MNLTRDRLQSIGWAFVLAVCAMLTLALTFQVNAVKSEVRLAERQIIAMKQEKVFLETEYLTRANQQQLRNLNDVEFGYAAPTAGQYIEGERQLAALGVPRAPDAPQQIRVASAAEDDLDDGFQAAVMRLGERKAGEDMMAHAGNPLSAGALDRRLSAVASNEHAKVAVRQ